MNILLIIKFKIIVREFIFFNEKLNDENKNSKFNFMKFAKFTFEWNVICEIQISQKWKFDYYFKKYAKFNF